MGKAWMGAMESNGYGSLELVPKVDTALYYDESFPSSTACALTSCARDRVIIHTLSIYTFKLQKTLPVHAEVEKSFQVIPISILICYLEAQRCYVPFQNIKH